MKPRTDRDLEDDLRPEYDLSKLMQESGVRGKYAQRYRDGTNLVRLAPDVARAFPDDDAVNRALRLVMQLADVPQRATTDTTER